MSKTLYSCLILTKLEFTQQVFENYSNIKFHENPSSGSPVVPCDGRKDITKLIVALRNFANAPRKTVTWYVLEGVERKLVPPW
jgi:hypothetical protein